MITHQNISIPIKNNSLRACLRLLHRLELAFWELFIRSMSNLRLMRSISPDSIFNLGEDDVQSMKPYWIITAVSGAVLGFIIGILSG